MEIGNLSINSENMLPIIKKWLYSDKDIFIRELVSNANDAIVKFQKLVSLGEAINNDSKYEIKVIIDEDNKTIQIIDNGIGMTADEVKQYINQIAFSGVTDFINKYEGKLNPEDQIIGHFGLGFYSAFMVADKVQIDTLSHIEGAEAVRWTCTGGIEYEMDKSERSNRGTTITLFIGEDGKEYLNEFSLRTILQKYCSFMPIEIYLEVVKPESEVKENNEPIEAEAIKENEEPIEENVPEPINDIKPLWLKDPKDCTEEEYKAFYSKLFHDFKEPLFWIHLNMDYPFRLKGILYFPKLNHELETVEGEIKLYNNQVYVADNIKEVIPEFMLLLKGVIDCPDLPLNVSRSFLQNDGYVTKISGYITKKIGDKLVSLFKSERENYEKFWDDISIFIKYGCIREEKLYDKVKDILLFKNTDAKYLTLTEYLENNTANENKVFYVSNEKQQAQYIKIFKEQNMDAVILDAKLDTAYMSFLESKNHEIKFVRIDSDLSENLKDNSNENQEDIKQMQTELENIFKLSLNKEKLSIKVESLKDSSVSSIMLLSEQARRMQEMYKMFGNAGFGDIPKDDVTLVLNKNNNLVQLLLKIKDDNNKSEDLNLICQQVYDLALLGNRPLETSEMIKFIERSNKILEKVAKL